ncbi:MAG: ribonuclease Z [Bacteroidales bacterium]|nr:ribonuclease Z [Bacteroidales bacterium]
MIRVTILGNTSAKPSLEGHPSSQIVSISGGQARGSSMFLMDAGEGAQIQMMRMHLSPAKLSAVFISHLHGDHVMGLFPLLQTLCFDRHEPLKIFAPAPFGEILDGFLKYFVERKDYDIVWVETNPSAPELVYEDDRATVTSIPLNHRVPCCGFLFREKKAEKIHPPSSSYAYISDTDSSADLEDPDSLLIQQIKGVDLLYHDTTYDDSYTALARRYAHSTASEAATVALKAGAGRLLIGHLSARYRDADLLLRQARTIFPNTFFAEECHSY